MVAKQKRHRPATRSERQGTLDLREPPPLKSCPACGAHQGELVKRQDRRFAFYIHCKACGYATEFSQLPGVAVGLWNDAARKGGR